MAAMWGGVFVAGRYLALQLPPFTVGALRFLVASAVLLPLVRLREGGLPRLGARERRTMILLGLTGVFAFSGFFFAGLERVPAGRGALIMALNPIVTALAMWLFFRERLDAARWLGIALALAGVAVIIARGELERLFAGALGPGELLLFGSVAGWVAYTLVGRQILGRVSVLAATTYATLFGTAMLVAAAAFERPWAAVAALDATGWVAVAYIGVFGTVAAFLFFYDGVRHIGPSRTAVFSNLVPVFGVSLAAALLDEPVLASMIVGGVMVIGGVLLTSRAPARRAP
jgi:drug/metabolite transporter (DMT)-like permease